MQETSEMTKPAIWSIFIVAGAMIAMMAVWWLASNMFGLEPPSSAGLITTAVSIIAAAMWFRRKTDRTMSQGERLSFAVGVTILNLVLPIIYVVMVLAVAGRPINLVGFDLVLAGGKGYLFKTAFLWLMLFTLLITFAQAYGFGWYFTREPRKRGK